MFYLENPEQQKIMFSLARWLLLTDWQEQGCIQWPSIALTKLMGWCWLLLAGGWSHLLLLLCGRSWGKVWTSVSVRAWTEVLHKHSCPSVKQCCNSFTPLQLGPLVLIWWSIGALLRGKWAPLKANLGLEEERGLLLVSSLAWAGLAFLVYSNQPGSRSHSPIPWASV